MKVLSLPPLGRNESSAARNANGWMDKQTKQESTPPCCSSRTERDGEESLSQRAVRGWTRGPCTHAWPGPGSMPTGPTRR